MSYARFTVLFFLTLALAAFLAQFVIDFNVINVAASSIVLASSLVILMYIAWTPAIQTHPLSTFAIFGFCVTTQLGALVVQSASWTSLTLNLRQPLETFATLAGFQFIALISHAVYRLFTHSVPTRVYRLSLLRSLLARLGLYTTPTVGTLWIMGLIGLSSFFLGGGDSITNKIFQGLTFVAWAPFLIPMFVLQLGETYCNAKKHYVFLAGYMGIIVLLGMAANARGLMLSGAMTIALFALLSAMRSNRPVKASQLAKLGVLVSVVAGLVIPVSDLVTAMVIARKVRTQSTAVQMIRETIYYFQQPQLLEAQRARDKFVSIQSSYDETYLASPLMARLIETKFHDNALYFGSRLTANDSVRLLNTTGDFFWTAMPDPVLKLLQIDVDKKELLFTMGDYLSHLAGAGRLGGYKTGSVFAQGIAISGWLFPFIYLIVCPILFWTHDLLTYRDAKGDMLVTTLGMLGIWLLFLYGISAESLHHLFIGVVRGLPQKILLFSVVFLFARICAKQLGRLVSVPKLSAAVST